MKGNTSSRGKWLIPVLLLVSGFCGISYEILYSKLLGNLLGNQFIIIASTLLTFLLGIGLGTLYAHRFVRYLWAIEAGIGVYAAAFVALYDTIDRLLYLDVPAIGTSIVACAAVSTVLLAVPAFLVGCSVPLFAAYLGTLRTTRVFSLTYGIYNIGAAITALGMEFALLRMFGLRATVLLLASLNVIVAVSLLALVRTTPLIPAPIRDRIRFAARDLFALVIAGIASAAFQLLMIKLAEFVFGPFNETFSLVLATVLLGLTFGSLAVAYLGLTFKGSLILAAGGVVLLLAGLPLATAAYALLYPAAVESYPLLVLLKFSLVVALVGLPATGFGSTIPALLREHRDVARESGLLLFLSSMGNVGGFLLTAFVLHRFLDYGPALVLIVFLTVVALGVHVGLRKPVVVAVVLLLLAVVSNRRLWDERLLYAGHTSFRSLDNLAATKRNPIGIERFKGYQDVFAITTIHGEPHFFINGYVSIPLTTSSEKLVGALSAMLSPRTDRAMVLGVGSGATASVVGMVFDRTDAVEINKVVLDHLSDMKEYNFDIENLPGVALHHDDGIHFVKAASEKYSLILNTVTTPLYFSSSKLYTKDFLEIVSGRLTEDGVYTTWIDSSIGDRGVDIILETLDGSFEECWMSYIKGSYFLMACSQSPLAFRQIAPVVGAERLRENLATEHELSPALIPYSVISTRAGALQGDPDAAVNTIDYPVLEYEMSRLSDDVSFAGLYGRLAERLDLRDVRDSVGGSMVWQPAEFLFWADRRLGDDAPLAESLETAVRRGFGDLDADYDRAAMTHGRELGNARGMYVSGRALLDRERYRAAAEAFAEAIERDPSSRSAHYYLGQSLEKLGETGKAREAYRAALQLDPDSTRAREALDRLGAGGGDRRDD